MFAVTAHNLALQAIADTIDTVKLHSAEPNASGVGFEISGATGAITYGTAAASSVDISSSVDVPVSAGDSVQWYSLWSGAVFRGKKAFTTGDTFSNNGFARITSLAITMSDL